MKRSGLTLIELLLAMAILVLIVLAVAQLFQQSTVAWETGHRRTKAAMVGRAIMGFVGQDMGTAIAPSGMGFDSLVGTNEIETVAYSGGANLTRGGVSLYENTSDDNPRTLQITAFDITVDSSDPPYYADIAMDVKTSDKGRSETRAFTRRVYLINRNRYYYD